MRNNTSNILFKISLLNKVCAYATNLCPPFLTLYNNLKYFIHVVVDTTNWQLSFI